MQIWILHQPFFFYEQCTHLDGVLTLMGFLLWCISILGPCHVEGVLARLPLWKCTHASLCVTFAKHTSSQFVVLGYTFSDTYHIKCRTHVCGTCLAMNVTWILRLPDIHNTHHKVKEFLKLHDGMHCIEHVFLCMVSYYVFCMFLYVFCTVRLLYICWAWPMWGKSSVCVFTHIACPATHSHHKQCTFHFTTSLLQVRSEALS